MLKWIERPSGGDREDTDGTGTVRYDVVCRLRSHLDGKRRISVILHVEGQNRPHPAFLLKKRMCCYLARLVASQKGKVFGGDDYGSLAPVVSVWLILNNPRWDQERIVEWTMAGLLGIYLSRKIGTREKVRRIERD